MSEAEMKSHYSVNGPPMTLSKLLLIVAIISGINSLYPLIQIYQDASVIQPASGDFKWHFAVIGQLFVALRNFAIFFAASVIVQLLSDIRWHLANSNSIKLGL
jgi:hypothetical protein